MGGIEDWLNDKPQTIEQWLDSDMSAEPPSAGPQPFKESDKAKLASALDTGQSSFPIFQAKPSEPFNTEEMNKKLFRLAQHSVMDVLPNDIPSYNPITRSVDTGTSQILAASVNNPVTQGVLQAGEELTTPKNILLMAGLGSGAIGGILVAPGLTVGKIVGAYFAGQMSRAAMEQTADAIKSFKAGKGEEGVLKLTKAAMSGVFAFGAGRGAVEKVKPQVSDLAEAAKRRAANEATPQGPIQAVVPTEDGPINQNAPASPEPLLQAEQKLLGEGIDPKDSQAVATFIAEKAGAEPPKVTTSPEELLYHGGGKDTAARGFLGGRSEPTWLSENRITAEAYAKSVGGEVFAVRKSDIPPEYLNAEEWWGEELPKGQFVVPGTVKLPVVPESGAATELTPISKTEGNEITLAPDANAVTVIHETKHAIAGQGKGPEPPENNDIIAAEYVSDHGKQAPPPEPPPPQKLLPGDFNRDVDQITTPQEQTKLGLRQVMSARAQSEHRMELQLHDDEMYVGRQSADERLDLVGGLEGANPIPEKFGAIASRLKYFQNRVVERAREFIRDDQWQNFSEEWFPHLFKNPEAVHGWVRKTMAGGQGWLKPQKYPTFEDALRAGWEPISDNPVTMFVARLGQINRYAFVNKAINKWLVDGTASEYPIPGSSAVPREATGSSRAIYMPDAAVNVIKNWLSTGMEDMPGFGEAFKWYRDTNNSLNQMQLSLSGFHFVTTAVHAMSGTFGLGAGQFLRGNRAEGIMNMARGSVFGPLHVAQMAGKGKKIIEDFYSKEIEDLPPELQAVVRAGGGFHPDRWVLNEYARRFQDAVNETVDREGGAVPSDYIKYGIWHPLQALKTGLEMASYPLMKQYVPSIKAAAFMELAKDTYSRFKDDPRALERQLARDWDSVDNRLGELRRDNLFFNKALTDALYASQRSFGWNFGTLRELGGAFKDIGTGAFRSQKGDPFITRRIEFLIGTAIVPALIGGLTMKIMTGKDPDPMKLLRNGDTPIPVPEDLLFPQVDKNDPSVRIAVPGYQNEIINIQERGIWHTLQAKMAPLPQTAFEIAMNKDYLNRAVRQGPVDQQIAQSLRYALSEQQPLSLQQFGKEGAIGLTGIRKAPSFVTKPRAEPKRKLSERSKLPEMPESTQTIEDWLNK